MADNALTGTELSGGRAVYSDVTDATATFTFNGTGVTWFGLSCDICGIAEVRIDGAFVAEVDTFTPATAQGSAAAGAMLDSRGLAPGDHTLTIRVTGRMNPSSGGANVVVDAFEVRND